MFNDPRANLEQLGLAPGMTVADLGIGASYHTLEAARMVGPEGKVYGLEVQKELIEHLRREARRAHLENVEAIWCNLEKAGGSTLPDDSMDAVLMTSVLFIVEDKITFTAEAKRILKPEGRLLLVDWRDSFEGIGPTKAQVLPEAAAEELLQQAGFSIERKIDAGDHHYGLIAKKN